MARRRTTGARRYGRPACKIHFDYAAEDKLATGGDSHRRTRPISDRRAPGYGKSLRPGTRNVRADTRSVMDRPMTLQGWSLPLSAHGRLARTAPAVALRATSSGIDCRGDPAAMAPVVPAP